jgi:hypothetical protein
MDRRGFGEVQVKHEKFSVEPSRFKGGDEFDQPSGAFVRSLIACLLVGGVFWAAVVLVFVW